MRTLLFLPLLALALPGCGFDCEPAGEFQTADRLTSLSAAPTVSDTLTVLFESDEASYAGSVEGIWVRLGAETPSPSGGEQTEVSLHVEYTGVDVETAPPFSASARADTLVVSVPGPIFAAAPSCAEREGLAQPVCSPAEPYFRLNVQSVRAPEGVRHVRFVTRGPGGFVRPLAPSASAPASTASRPSSRRSVRT